jgi:tetratricopeptide (TPR) repeat protein
VSPGDAAKIEGLGFNAFINKDYSKALEYYEQVLAINPNYPGAASQRDKCLEALGMK